MAGKFSLADHIQKSQPPATRDIETITSEILDAKRVGGEAILTIGKGLIEAKAMLPHGEWLPWLEDRVEISTRMAQNYMRLAQHYSNTNALSYLGATKALQLLALPESERDEFLNESHEVSGERKNVIDMTSRELAIAIKERDDALRTAAQAQAEQAAAEQAREKLSQDVKFANERITGLNSEISALKSNAKIAKETADKELKEARQAAILHQKSFEESEKEVARLEQALEELRSRPVDVAVQADEAAVEAARKEVEGRMQAQLDEARKAQAEAEKSRKAAEDAKADAQMEVIKANTMLEEARRQAEDAQRQAEETRKKAAVTTDPDLVLFSELLDQGQTIANRMGGIRQKKKAKDPETAEKLQAAMMAFSSMVKEVALQ